MPPPTRSTQAKPLTPTTTINEQSIGDKEPTLKQIMGKLNEIVRALDYNTAQQNDMLERLTNIEKENKALRDENANLNKRVANIEGFFYQQQQQQLHTHITIHGIPKKNNEEIHTTIINTIKEIDIHITKENIIHARRMLTTNSNNTAPPIIVVQLNTTNIKQQIMQAFKSNGPIILSQISNAQNTEGKRIYINEYLNNYYQQLYSDARKLKTSNNFKFVWFKNGIIYARQTEASHIYKIKHQNDIANIQSQPSTI